MLPFNKSMFEPLTDKQASFLKRKTHWIFGHIEEQKIDKIKHLCDEKKLDKYDASVLIEDCIELEVTILDDHMDGGKRKQKFAEEIKSILTKYE